MSSRAHNIKIELDTDSLARGYAGMTDLQVADDMNTVYRTRDVDTLSASQIFEAIENTDWDTLIDSEKDKVRLVLDLGDKIQISQSSKARTMLQAALGGTTSATNLGNLVTENISRAEEIGVGIVKESHITFARSL